MSGGLSTFPLKVAHGHQGKDLAVLGVGTLSAGMMNVASSVPFSDRELITFGDNLSLFWELVSSVKFFLCDELPLFIGTLLHHPNFHPGIPHLSLANLSHLAEVERVEQLQEAAGWPVTRSYASWEVRLWEESLG